MLNSCSSSETRPRDHLLFGKTMSTDVLPPTAARARVFTQRATSHVPNFRTRLPTTYLVFFLFLFFFVGGGGIYMLISTSVTLISRSQSPVKRRKKEACIGSIRDETREKYVEPKKNRSGNRNGSKAVDEDETISCSP